MSNGAEVIADGEVFVSAWVVGNGIPTYCYQVECPYGWSGMESRPTVTRWNARMGGQEWNPDLRLESWEVNSK